MLHSYQCILHCCQRSQKETGILVAASGSYIHTFSGQSGRYLSTWPSLRVTAQTRSTGQNEGQELKAPHLKSFPRDGCERPLKRPRPSPAREESGSSSAEIVVAADSDDGGSPDSQQVPNPPIIKLAGTSAGQHVIAVTGEDKCIRVFDLAVNGTLTQLSERQDSDRRLPCCTH